MLRPLRKANAETRRVFNKALKTEAHSPLCKLYIYIYIYIYINVCISNKILGEIELVPVVHDYPTRQERFPVRTQAKVFFFFNSSVSDTVLHIG